MKSKLILLVRLRFDFQILIIVKKKKFKKFFLLNNSN